MAHSFIAAVGTLAWIGMAWSSLRVLATYPDDKAAWEEMRRTFLPCAAVLFCCLILLALMGPRPA